MNFTPKSYAISSGDIYQLDVVATYMVDALRRGDSFRLDACINLLFAFIGKAKMRARKGGAA